MSIPAFQNACHENNFSTSFHTTKTENILPQGSPTEKYVIRFWEDLGSRFSFDEALQNTSVVFDPKNKNITYPNEEQLEKLDERMSACVFPLLSCLKKEPVPIMGDRVKHILGNTVVDKSQQETDLLSFQV